MTEFETILLESDTRGVARLTLNRPARHNALSSLMIGELTVAANKLAADQTIRAVVIAAEGKSFCAGADLDWMRQQFSASAGERKREAKRFAAMLRAIDELPQLVIAVIDGPAYGGGVGLAVVCDLVIAGPAARFALTETRLGIIPATIAPFLHRRIGAAALRRLALHGEPFTAAQAMALGLVSEAVAAGETAGCLDHHLVQLLTCAPGAVADAKQLFRQIAAGAASETDTINALARRWTSAEAQAGIAAFFGKVKPPWQT